MILTVVLTLAWTIWPTDAQYARNSYALIPEDLSFQELTSILKERKFSRISDLLSHLRITKPKYMKYYTLGYGSKSLQESSLMHPRAIVYGQTANLIIAFNGAREQSGYEMLEVAAIHPSKKKFEFFEIEFNEKGQLGSLPYRISPEGGPEKKCLACHTDSRPIWNHYDIWPGFYGSSDDFPLNLNNKTGGISVFGLGPSQKSRDEWNAFLTRGITQGRYQSLVPPSDTSYGRPAVTPNADLNEALFAHNLNRIEGLLKEGRADGPVRYALLYGMRCEGAHRRDASLQKSELGVVAAAFSRKANQAHRLHEAAIFQEHATELGFTPAQIQRHLKANSHLAPTSREPREFFRQYVSRAQIDLALFLSIVDKYLPRAQVETWPLQQREGVHRYDTGSLFSGYLYRVVLSVAFGSSPSAEDQSWLDRTRKANEDAFLTTGREASEARETALCKELANKALQEVAPILPTLARQRVPKHPITNCASCHASGSVGPRIEFQNPSALRKQLADQKRDLGREICRRLMLPATHSDVMPPRGMGQSERSQVIGYLSSIAEELNCRR